MAKLTLSTITNLQNESTALGVITANNTAIVTAMENTLSRDGTSPNTMAASLDMNSNRIINLPAPAASTEAARKADLDALQAAVSSASLTASVAAAAASATAAAASATAAATSATAAATSATSAATQATNAATSATAAASSATSASTSATAAASSATSAATSATTATTQATAAASSASAASSSASSASTSASNASTSASNASTSATNASNSASTASTQATNASTSATNAATSATNAATSATSASSSASAASTSATAAAASATSAAALLGNAYLWSTNTASSDPGSGTIKGNNGTLSSVSAIYVSETDNNSNGIAALIATLGTSTNTNKSILRISKTSSPTTVWHEWYITAAVTDNGSWDTLTATYITGAGTFANADPVIISSRIIGNVGAAGTLDFNTLTGDTPVSADLLVFGDISDSNNPNSTTIQTAVDMSILANGSTFPNAGLHILDTNASHDLIITPGSDLTADRVLTITTGDAARTLDISAGSVTISTSGAALIDDASAAAQATTLGLGTGDSPQFTAIQLGHASDTTIARVAAGSVSIEGVTIPLPGVATTWTAVQGYAPAVLTFAASQTWDVSTNPIATLAMTANITSFSVSGVTAGRIYVLKVTQDSSVRTIAYTGANFKFNGGSAPTLSTGSGAIDYYVFIGLSSTVLHEIGRTQAVA